MTRQRSNWTSLFLFTNTEATISGAANIIQGLVYVNDTPLAASACTLVGYVSTACWFERLLVTAITSSAGGKLCHYTCVVDVRLLAST